MNAAPHAMTVITFDPHVGLAMQLIALAVLGLMILSFMMAAKK